MNGSKDAIEVHDLTVSYQHKPVLWAVDFSIPKTSVVAIVGPNGAGKSTLIKAIMGLLPLSSGQIKIFGEPRENRRNALAYVPQRNEVDWDFPINVFDVVLMARSGRLPFYRRPTEMDREAASNALVQVGMQDFASRQISQLSGGQQQRVFIARALAQEAEIYLLDEPFAGVDAATESAIAELFEKLRAKGKTIICVHHDLNTVPQYFDWLVLLNLRLVAAGELRQTFNAENLNKTYGGRLGLLAEVSERLKESGFQRRT